MLWQATGAEENQGTADIVMRVGTQERFEFVIEGFGVSGDGGGWGVIQCMLKHLG